MSQLRPDNVLDVAFDRDRWLDETSDEPFDRAELALQALAILRPRRTTVAVCMGHRMRVDAGRMWGRGERGERGEREERWALLVVSPCASRRAVVTAVATLARAPRPYALALLGLHGLEPAQAPAEAERDPVAQAEEVAAE
jgi:hypothetical protein